MLSDELQEKLRPILKKSCTITDLADFASRPSHLRVIHALQAVLHTQIPPGRISTGPMQVDFENGEARIEVTVLDRTEAPCLCQGLLYCIECGGLIKRGDF
jgi:hypothetical protein